MLSVCVSDLLDDGLHAYHHPGDGRGSHFRLEVDDPNLHHPKCHPHIPLQGEMSSLSVCLSHLSECFLNLKPRGLSVKSGLWSNLVYSS